MSSRTPPITVDREEPESSGVTLEDARREAKRRGVRLAFVLKNNPKYAHLPAPKGFEMGTATQGGEEVSRSAHTREVAGSIPAPATTPVPVGGGIPPSTPDAPPPVATGGTAPAGPSTTRRRAQPAARPERPRDDASDRSDARRDALKLYVDNLHAGDTSAWERGRAAVLYRGASGGIKKALSTLAVDAGVPRATVADEVRTFEAFSEERERVVGRTWTHHAKALRAAKRLAPEGDLSDLAKVAKTWLERTDLVSVRELVTAMTTAAKEAEADEPLPLIKAEAWLKRFQALLNDLDRVRAKDRSKMLRLARAAVEEAPAAAERKAKAS